MTPKPELLATGGDTRTSVGQDTPSLLDRIAAAGGLAPSRDEWENLMDVVHPARRLFARHPVYRGIEVYAYNEVAPLYLPFTHPEMREHFLPHLGLLLARTFPDPRVTSQYATHQLLHCFLGWPLPVRSNLDRYSRACSDGEILAATDTEFALFERLPAETDGMFDPAYPSLHDAFKAVGVRTLDDAVREATRMQHATSEAEALPRHVREHPNFKGGVAVTLHRQAAWADHDREWARLNWHRQRAHPGLLTVWNSLWTPDGHRTIFERHKDHAGKLVEYGETHDHDTARHRERLLTNLRRTSAALLGRDPGPPSSVEHALDLHRQASGSASDPPMPLWNLATEFHAYRRGWEERLRASTERWRAAA